MPVYLVHGFRWPREGFTGIRVHAIVHNLEDCSVEYIQNENSKADLLSSFRKAHPDVMKELEGPNQTLDFIEQYDPDDTEGPQAVSQPYAFVADKVITMADTLSAHTVAAPTGATTAGTSLPTTTSSTSTSTPSRPKTPLPNSLSVNIEEVLAEGPGLSAQAWDAMADLRDKIAEGEKIGWWVVYNGDPERAFPDSEDEEDSEDEDDEEGEEQSTGGKVTEAGTTAPLSTSPQAQRSPSYNTQQQSTSEIGTALTSSSQKPLPTPPTQQQQQQQQQQSQQKPKKLPQDPNSPQTPPKIPSFSRPTNILPSRQKSAQNLPTPKHENIPEPAVLKDAEKTKPSGFRKKFFGKKV